MAKQKKKRNKKYQGSEAAARPSVTRVSAVNRSKPGQWWFDHKRVAKPVAIATGVAVVVVLIAIELISLLV